MTKSKILIVEDDADVRLGYQIVLKANGYETFFAADTVGARALLVHAKDDNAEGFYQHFDFEPSQSDPYHLLLIMKDLLRMVGK